ncbi:MAG: aminoglycoside adenylyltransferase domain-containing protein [Planctomycetota bacterium]
MRDAWRQVDGVLLTTTPDAALNTVLGDWVGGLRAALGERLVAVCLQGSFAVGDFDEHSDADFVVAVEGELGAVEVERLQALHGGVFERDERWAKHLEGSYFPVEVLRSCDRRGEALWYLDHGASRLIESDHCNTAVVRKVVREYGVRLWGAEPRGLVDAVPRGLLRSEMYETARGWGESVLADPDPWASRFYQGFLVLNYCRVWCDLVTGALGSKRRGAEWAKECLGVEWQGLIDRAWATRPDPAVSARMPADPDDFARTLELVRRIIDEMGRTMRHREDGP